VNFDKAWAFIVLVKQFVPERACAGTLAQPFFVYASLIAPFIACITTFHLWKNQVMCNAIEDGRPKGYAEQLYEEGVLVKLYFPSHMPQHFGIHCFFWIYRCPSHLGSAPNSKTTLWSSRDAGALYDSLLRLPWR
jgi:hypothetical protein